MIGSQMAHGIWASGSLSRLAGSRWDENDT
jgi:hypothetical protein